MAGNPDSDYLSRSNVLDAGNPMTPDALADALGVRVSKVAPEALRELFRSISQLDFIGFEEHLLLLLGEDVEEEEANYYSVDEEGNVTALVIFSINPVRIEVIGRFSHLKSLLLLTDITAEVARNLTALAKLEFLGLGELKSGTRTLRLICQIQSLRTLGLIESGEPVDVSCLRDLPHLTTLMVNTEHTHLETLSTHPALTHLMCDLENGANYLSKFDHLETLVAETADGDLSFLRSMGSLRRLNLKSTIVPLTILRDLTHLKVLGIAYPHESLEPLFNLEELEELQLSGSKLTDLHSLAGFDRLKRLDLSKGQLKNIVHLEGQESIKYLNLSENPIDVVPAQLAMPFLEVLSWNAGPSHRLGSGDFLAECSRLTSMNLPGHELSDLGFLTPLGNLRHLDLSGNRIEDISPLERLPSLTSLDLHNNKVRQLEPLTSCTSLGMLNVRENPIENVSVLSRLRELRSLDLANTGIKDLGFTKRLRNLFRLHVSRNLISSVEPLLELPNLVKVDLGFNQLTQIPPEILERRGLESMVLTENPLQGLSQELYSGWDGRETLARLRDYYRGLARGRAKHDQAKLLLVGNGRVGKTSIVSRLLDNEFDADQPSTHGIQLRHWPLPGVATERLDGSPLNVDIWDFGGQDIYHATHRLFMKTRALFLLVWDHETERARYSADELGQRYENFRLPYWIDYIKALSGSPVIIVQNKVDTLVDKESAYGQEMKGVYPPPGGVLDYRYVSARRSTQNGMPGLRESIELALEDLGSIGYELPAQWVDVRDRLLAMNARHLEYERFAELCTSVGLPEVEHRSLVSFLHETGTLFYQPEYFGERLILDQRWAIEAVYALFDRRDAAYADLKAVAKDGLTLDQLKRKVWHNFSIDEHRLLLEFMRSCEICFEFSEGIYYVPQLLPEEMPSRVRLRWSEPTQYCLRIDYTFLHRAIIDRFLVRAGLLGADDVPEIWKNGIVIYHVGSATEAMIEGVLAENRIRVYAKGDSPVEMLQMIRREFEDLHRDFPATIAVSADGAESFVDLEVLRQYAEAGAEKVPSLASDLVDSAPLGVFRDTRNLRLPKGKRRTAAEIAEAESREEIFVSYAWGGPDEIGESREAIVDRLCAALEANGRNVIRDKKDFGYKGKISRFMRRIGRGKRIVVVVSQKYLKSPYCMFELLEIYEHGRFEQRVFPIVLGDADLYDLGGRLEYVLHWMNEKKRIEGLINDVGVAALAARNGAIQEYNDYYRRVFHNMDTLTTLLADWNALTPKLLEENSFELLLGQLEESQQSPSKPLDAEVETSINCCARRIHTSSSDRCQIKPIAVRTPRIVIERGASILNIAADRIRRQSLERLMNPLLVVVLSEGVKFSLKVGSIPDNEATKILSPNRSGKPFNKGMRRRRIRDTFDFLDFKNTLISLPLVVPK